MLWLPQRKTQYYFLAQTSAISQIVFRIVHDQILLLMMIIIMVMMMMMIIIARPI
jgi:hypothetical protein